MDQKTRVISIALLVIVVVVVVLIHAPKSAENPGSSANTIGNGQSLPQTYSNSSEGFSFRLPTGYKIDESYTYQQLGPDKDIKGVKFTIPESLATGSNLSPDTYISVEEIPQTQNCSAARFLDAGAKVMTVTEGSMTYSIASSTGAAAGNRYEETVYALPGTNPCMAVRYFIHYGVFENYPPGTVKQFDKDALLKQFDAIRQTLAIVQQAKG